MVDPSGHWGKMQYGAFVHQDITQLAFTQYTSEHKMGILSSIVYAIANANRYRIILAGSILPDFINDKDKSASNAEDKYGDSYYKEYSKYDKEFLWKIFCKKKKVNKKILDNTLHGKNKKRLKKLKKAAKKKIMKKPYDKKSLLIFGCVLHSIQDYQAHSFVGYSKKGKRQTCDLEIYKKTKNKKKFSKKENAFHMDWYEYAKENIRKEEKVKNQKDVHKRTKDNPNTVFAYNNRTKKWEWRGKFDSKEENIQYRESIKQSVKYFKEVF